MRVGIEELGKFEDVKSVSVLISNLALPLLGALTALSATYQQIESYVAEIAGGKPKEELFNSFSLLLFRMATTEAHLERSVEAEAASAREHARLSRGALTQGKDFTPSARRDGA